MKKANESGNGSSKKGASKQDEKDRSSIDIVWDEMNKLDLRESKAGAILEVLAHGFFEAAQCAACPLREEIAVGLSSVATDLREELNKGRDKLWAAVKAIKNEDESVAAAKKN